MNVQLNRHAMNFGLLMGAVFSLNFLVSTIPGLAFLQFIIAICIVYLTYRLSIHCRDKALGGVISYSAALGYIVQLYMYGSMIVALFKYIFYKFIKPDLLTEQLNQSMKVLEKTSFGTTITSDVYEMTMETLTPLNMAVQSIWINVLYGLFIGLIIAGIVKKEKSIFEE